MSGAGLEVFNYSQVTMNGGEISNNTATSYGGGVWIRGNEDADKSANLILNGGTIKNNNAGIAHGGIYNGVSGTYTYKSGVVCGNKPSNSYETSATCPS